MKSSVLKNTMPISYVQHGFCTLYQLQNKKKPLSEVCLNFCDFCTTVEGNFS